MLKNVKYTLKILWGEHRKIFKVRLAIFQYFAPERLNTHTFSTVSLTKLKKLLRQNVEDNLRLPMRNRITFYSYTKAMRSLGFTINLAKKLLTY